MLADGTSPNSRAKSFEKPSDDYVKVKKKFREVMKVFPTNAE